MRAIVLGAAIAALSVTPALADTWSAAYGGTITATYADGRVVKVYVEPNGSYTIVPAAGGETIRGTWADAGGQSCFTINEPAAYAGGAPVCLPAKEYKVGDSFQAADSTGQFTGVISAGR